MSIYSDMYLELQMNGESEEDAAELVDLALCEDYERRRLKRQPTHEEVRNSYQRMSGAPQS